MTNLFLESKDVELKIYKECKYTANKETFKKENRIDVIYNYCTGFEIVSGKEAEALEAGTDGSCIDDYHEYLILFFEDGDTATFRNSYVDLFII